MLQNRKSPENSKDFQNSIKNVNTTEGEQNTFSDYDSHDHEFEDNDDCAGWDDIPDDNDDIFNYSNYYKPLSSPNSYLENQKEGIESVSYFDPNSTNNNNKILTSNKSLPTVKSWVCENCNAINNLHHSLSRFFECISCSGKYRPGQLLIECIDEDKSSKPSKECHPDMHNIYNVWICNFCEWTNDMKWVNCNCCLTKKTEKDLLSFHSKESPKKYKLSSILNEKDKQYELYDNKDKQYELYDNKNNQNRDKLDFNSDNKQNEIIEIPKENKNDNVWICIFCQWPNDMEWLNCGKCKIKKPNKNLISFHRPKPRKKYQFIEDLINNKNFEIKAENKKHKKDKNEIDTTNKNKFDANQGFRFWDDDNHDNMDNNNNGDKQFIISAH